MKWLSWLSMIGAAALCIVGPRNAYALTVPDSGTCTGGGVCLTITAPGTALTDVGVQGTGATGVAGYSSYSTAEGVFGSGSSGATGVYGLSDTGSGIFGKSTSQYGVQGTSGCGTGGSCIGVYGTSAAGNGVWGNTGSTTNAAVVGLAPSGGLAFYGSGGIEITASFAQKAGGGAWTAPSDSRIKKDVSSFDRGLAALLSVQPVRFKYNGLGGTADDGRQFVGVIAQDLEKVLPAMVTSRMVKLHSTDAKDSAIKVVDPSDFTYLLINAVKEQQKIIQSQEARIAALEHGKAPFASSFSSAHSLQAGMAIGVLPIGLAIALRGRRRKRQN